MQAEVRTLERVSERIKDGIRDIDARATRISQTATRVGDRLQVSMTNTAAVAAPVKPLPALQLRRSCNCAAQSGVTAIYDRN